QGAPRAIRLGSHTAERDAARQERSLQGPPRPVRQRRRTQPHEGGTWKPRLRRLRDQEPLSTGLNFERLGQTNDRRQPINTAGESMKRLATLCAAGLAALAFALGNAAELTEGKEYSRLKNPQPVEPGKTIE